MALLEAVVGCPVDGSGEIDLPAATIAGAAVLLPEGRRYVGIAPGASGPPRYWPLERQIALAGWIAEQGWQPVILLGPMESHMLAPLRQALPGALFPGGEEGGTLADIDLWLALGRRLSAAVSNDTGTGHLLGESGATRALEIFDAEIRRTMGVLGCAIIAPAKSMMVSSACVGNSVRM